MFGKVQEIPQKETTPFYPRSPYGVAKLYAYWITVNYREAYQFFACNGILFNHESPRRGGTFVTRKITTAVAKIALGKQDILYLGNLNARRDWGHAKDYVRAMWLMLQQPNPEDYVIATGSMISVREFTKKAFEVLDMELSFEGDGQDEVGRLTNSVHGRNEGDIIIRIDSIYYRPTEVDQLVGDATKARTNQGWELEYSLESMIKEMVLSDYASFKSQK